MRRITGVLSYANVAATLALFISLGGASYAAVALPANSVGARQLRDGSITPRSLSFPLAARGITDEKVQDLTKGPCNAPNRPGVVVNVLCPPRVRAGTRTPGVIRTPGRELSLRLGGAGDLLASAIVGLRDDGPPNTTAEVQLQLIIDGRSASVNDVVLVGGQQAQVPLQRLQRENSGAHTIGIKLDASYSSPEPGDVFAAPVSLVASALPAQH